MLGDFADTSVDDEVRLDAKGRPYNLRRWWTTAAVFGCILLAIVLKKPLAHTQPNPNPNLEHRFIENPLPKLILFPIENLSLGNVQITRNSDPNDGNLSYLVKGATLQRS